MKKILSIALIAMMLVSMVAFAGCKPKAQEEEAVVEEVAVPEVDTTVAQPTPEVAQ